MKNVFLALSLFFVFAPLNSSQGEIREDENGALKERKADSGFASYTFYDVKLFNETKKFSCQSPVGYESIRLIVVEKENKNGKRNIQIRGKSFFGSGTSEDKTGTCLWNDSMSDYKYSCLNGKITFTIPLSHQMEVDVIDRHTGLPSLYYEFDGVYNKLLGNVPLDCTQMTSYTSCEEEFVAKQTVCIPYEERYQVTN